MSSLQRIQAIYDRAVVEVERTHEINGQTFRQNYFRANLTRQDLKALRVVLKLAARKERQAA